MSSNENVTLAKQDNGGLANADTKKKIGFFSAMLVVVGSSVGAGIFFKAGGVLTNSQGSVVFAIFCWLLAAFAVICMALALVEIASARNDNLSVIGWCKTFNSRFIYKACKNFMFYIYLPLTYFFMPLYVIMSIQDGVQGFGAPGTFGGKADWAVAMVIALLMSVYFIVVCGFSTKIGNIQNWIITSVKFLPLIFCAIIGFVIVGISGFQGGFHTAVGNGVDFVPGMPTENYDPHTFEKLSPGIGMFIAAGAIFFAYDGFYVAAGIQSEMKEPKKTPLAILLGMIVVTVIYLFIAISMSIGSASGSPFGLKEWLATHTSVNGVNWLYGLLQLLIGIGVLGIINGFAMWAPRFTEDLIKEQELPFSQKYMSKLNDAKPKVGIVYNLVITLPIVLIFCIIGGLGYVDAVGYGPDYGEGMGSLYSFCDLMGTWTALLAFAFIVVAIFGGIKNRKQNFVQTQRTKYFLPTAYLSIIFVGLPLFFTFIQPFINVFLMFNYKHIPTDVIVSRILLVVVFFIFIALMIVPTIIEDYLAKKKYGSVEEYEKQKLAFIGQLNVQNDVSDVVKDFVNEIANDEINKQEVQQAEIKKEVVNDVLLNLNEQKYEQEKQQIQLDELTEFVQVDEKVIN